MSYVQPSRADVHVNRPLTNISIAYMQDAADFVADRVFPVVSVAKQSDRYFIYDRGYWNRDEMKKRAPSSESAGSGFDIDSTPTYYCDVWALHKDIDEQTRANADSPINLDRDATNWLALKALIRKEKAWATRYFTSGVWATDATGVSAAPGAGQFLRWNDAASNPIEDIRLGKRTVKQSTGLMPNKLTMGRQVYDTLVDHPDIVGRLDRGQTTGPAKANRDSLAALFEVDEVLVMDSIENTAKEGAANAHSFIGGKHALLTYSPAMPSVMTASAGYTFAWTGLMGAGALGGRISKFYIDAIKSDRIEIELAFDQKIVANDLGYFFLTAIA